MIDNDEDIFDIGEDDIHVEKKKRNKRKTPHELTAALMSTEDNVAMPTRVRVSSVTGNLISLAIGDTFTKSIRLPEDCTLGELLEECNKWKEGLRQSVNSSIRNARNYDGRTFSMESVQTLTPTGKVYLQVIVTRVG